MPASAEVCDILSLTVAMVHSGSLTYQILVPLQIKVPGCQLYIVLPTIIISTPHNISTHFNYKFEYK